MLEPSDKKCKFQEYYLLQASDSRSQQRESILKKMRD